MPRKATKPMAAVAASNDPAVLAVVARVLAKIGDQWKKALAGTEIEEGGHEIDVCLRVSASCVQERGSDGRDLEIRKPAYSLDDLALALVAKSAGASVQEIDRTLRGMLDNLPHPASQKKADDAKRQQIAAVRDMVEDRLRSIQLEDGWSRVERVRTAGRAGSFRAAPKVALASSPAELAGASLRPSKDYVASAEEHDGE